MAVRKIVAKKGNRTRQFNENEWNLLGKDKSGWVQVSDMTVENTIATGKATEKKIVVPPTGNKKVQEINVTNTNNTNDDSKKDEKANPPADAEVSQEKKDEFMLALEGLTKNVIKDAFDNQTPPVPYENRTTLDALKLQLAEYCGWDLTKQQSMFSK